MKRYMFELQAYKKIIVEAASLEEARNIACFDEMNQEITVDYVSNGEEVSENK